MRRKFLNRFWMKPLQNISSEPEEYISLKQKICKIEKSISTQNGVRHYEFDALKINGNNDILLIIVGYNGSISGSENKYFRIAKRANEVYGNTVFIVDNNERNWDSPENYFNVIINYVKENTLSDEIKIKLFGNSAGATLAISYAWKCPEITKMLLVNPPLFEENLELIADGIKLFGGSATLVMGKNDPSYELAKLFVQEKYTNIFKEIVFYDNADHKFKGLISEFVNLPFQYLYDRISLSV